MTHGPALEPVRKNVVVQLPAARAFELFTAGFGRWWPRSHTIGRSPQRDAVIEPRAGGRWYEVGEDGSECDWGVVLAWEPPQRVLLGWQLGADFRFDPASVSEVEVRFVAETPAVTRVELEHRGFERHGARGAQLRSSVDSEGGWGALVAAYASAASE